MSIRKVRNGDTWFCDGAYLYWNEKKKSFCLEGIEGEMYRDESILHYLFDKNGLKYCIEEYVKSLKEPQCSECQKDGVLESSFNDNWWISCQCHDTPHFKDPFKAWENWEKYCKGEIK